MKKMVNKEKIVQENLSLEERTHLLEGAVAFASYVTDRYKQVGEDGRLNYYISGSLAVMLLAMAESADMLDASKIPSIAKKEAVDLPKNFTEKLKGYARKINDLDYVPTSALFDVIKKIPAYSDDPKDYARERKKYLWKGGGGPAFDELPAIAREIFNKEKTSVKVMCDPVTMYSDNLVLQIRIQGKDYFIADLSQMLGYKTLQMMQHFSAKPDSFKRDFSAIHDSLLETHAEKELIESAYGVLVGFEDELARFGPRISKYMENLEDCPEFNSTARQFIEKMKDHDSGNRKIMQHAAI